MKGSILAKGYYRILGLSEGASTDEIRERYRSWVAKGHPDTFLDPVEKTRAEENIKQLNKAYEILHDPRRRAVYDRRLANQRKRLSVKPIENYTTSNLYTPSAPVETLDGKNLLSDKKSYIVHFRVG